MALIIIRLFLILSAYVVAVLGASAFLHIIAWPIIAPLNQEAPWLVAGGLFVSVPLIALFASYYAFVPAAIWIGISELGGYRSWVFHALAGGVAALIGLVLARQTGGNPGITPPPPDRFGELPLIWLPQVTAATVTAATVAAGMVGGMAYWLVAGRSAGGWRRSPDPTVPEQSGS